MGILADSSTRAVVQGITGHAGAFHARRMAGYGTQVVAGVTPGKGGETVEGVPVFDTMAQAVAATGANASVIFVPAPFAADAMMEAADARVALVVCITEGIPALDMARARAYARERGVRVIGPNCPGLATPPDCKLGIIPERILTPGPIGVVSRSGTLTYEAIWQLSCLGLGQSTAVGIGGDPIVGSSFVDVLELFERDDHTAAVVLIGEIGGSAEEEVAEFIRTRMTKPVAAFIAGRTAPPGKRMGHAGAIVAGSAGTADEKIRALTDAGVRVADNPARIGETLQSLLKGRRL
ncbi:MAG TPA: succinate--CoA ligase subunit alpha [Planctomycetota bacterium]|nr:succinate--CoA ligase subunit alpha [Planctomycetota bacterium]HRR80640.1 succinate--CoA ligase subunit alpha [Planctomycetota bacterium]HRT96235.1 succinate--CoA ligase subunit alpha [Planctomycetota bacterium]